MAEKEKKDAKAPEAAPAEGEAKKKGLPIKTIAIVAVLMILEGALVFFVLGAMGGPKKTEAATEAKHLEHDESEQTVEIRLFEKEDERFQNLTAGRVWIWNVSFFVQVKNKNSERVENVLEQRKAEIKEGVSQIVSRSPIAQLKEPERQSLNRQVTALLDKVLGQDSDGKSLVERVLIPTCNGFPSDF
ncbi:MAG: hypothetical protein K2W85_00190 [Phycisphaerales bacterium]|nr:hypothetical protein [Phycisphaerales bacterium]